MLPLPWIPDIQVQRYKTHCAEDYCYYCWRRWAQLTKTSRLLTSTPTLSRITADTAGVESSPFWPTQTRLNPFPAAILVIICQWNKINFDRIYDFSIEVWLLETCMHTINSHKQQGYHPSQKTQSKSKTALCRERKQGRDRRYFSDNKGHTIKGERERILTTWSWRILQENGKCNRNEDDKSSQPPENPQNTPIAHSPLYCSYPRITTNSEKTYTTYPRLLKRIRKDDLSRLGAAQHWTVCLGLEWIAMLKTSSQ